MNGKRSWMIYGANGYTGRLVAQEAKRQGLAPIIAGRDAAVIQARRRARAPVGGLRPRRWAATRRALADVAVVANCAGPFSATSADDRGVPRCLHPLRRHHRRNRRVPRCGAAARGGERAGIVLCPGVVRRHSTDCVAACLVEALPDARFLALGFKGLASRSPGTARTAIEATTAAGACKDGAIVAVPLAHRTRKIDFGTGAGLRSR
jgi:short subunit dehydrogenase-like uncharacterized protein